MALVVRPVLGALILAVVTGVDVSTELVVFSVVVCWTTVEVCSVVVLEFELVGTVVVEVVPKEAKVTEEVLLTVSATVEALVVETVVVTKAVVLEVVEGVPFTVSETVEALVVEDIVVTKAVVLEVVEKPAGAALVVVDGSLEVLAGPAAEVVNGLEVVASDETTVEVEPFVTERHP